MKRPLALLTVVFCSGIILADRVGFQFIPTYIVTILCLFFSLLYLKKERVFFVSLCCLAVLLGALFLKNSQTLSKRHLANFIYYKDKSPYIISGFVDNLPEVNSYRTVFLFRVNELQRENSKYNSCGKILVILRGRIDLQYAEELLLKGKLYRPFGFGKSSYKKYLYNQGVYCLMRLSSANAVFRLRRNNGFKLTRFAFWLKSKMEEIIFGYVSPLAASILDAMILGERRGIPPLVNNIMARTGTVHILVVSGFNVGIVALILFLLLKLTRLPRFLRFCLAVFGLLVYCLMTGASNPVVRATIMTIVFMLAYFFKRDPDIYNCVSTAALFILVVNPRQLFDVGFQLSFVSVLAIIYFYPRLKHLIPEGVRKIRLLRFFSEGCLVSLSAWLGTMGFVAYYFRIFSPVTVIANVFIVPLATLITLNGFSLILVALIFPPAAPLFATTAELAVAVLLKLNFFLARLPLAWFCLPESG